MSNEIDITERKKKQPREPVVPYADRLIYTQKEAADILGLSPRTLWTMTNCGEINAVKIRGSVRYTRAELIRFTESLDA